MHFSQAEYFASVDWWIISQKLKKGGSSSRFQRFGATSVICVIQWIWFAKLFIAISLQLSCDVIYGFLLVNSKCTFNIERDISLCRCLLTFLYSGLKIKASNASVSDIFPQYVPYATITWFWLFWSRRVEIWWEVKTTTHAAHTDVRFNNPERSTLSMFCIFFFLQWNS